MTALVRRAATPLWLWSALAIIGVVAGAANVLVSAPGPAAEMAPAVKIYPLGTKPSLIGAYEFGPVLAGHGITQAGVVAPERSWRYAIAMRAVDAPAGLFVQVVLTRTSDGTELSRRQVVVRESRDLEWYEMPAGRRTAMGEVFELEVSVLPDQAGHLAFGAGRSNLIPDADMLLNGEPTQGGPTDLRVLTSTP